MREMTMNSCSLKGDVSNVTEESWIKLPPMETPYSRAQLIARIEKIASTLVQDVSSGRFPKLADSESLSDTVGDEKQENPRQKSLFPTINFGTKSSRSRFALMIVVLSVAHELLITNKTMNRRALYYKLKTERTLHLAGTQAHVDRAINSLANLLNCSPWKLHLIPTCKSLVAGDIKFYLADKGMIDCSTSGDTLIPQIAFDVKSIRARAKFVLVVEKDTVFQQLYKRNCSRILNCILITGKGYPDVTARMLVKILCEEMSLPTYILVDGDPFGVEIMLVYRYGSSSLSRETESLACPSIRWLGVFPSELKVLNAKTIPLTEQDSSKLKVLATKTLPITASDSTKLKSLGSQSAFFFVKEKILQELSVMSKGKAEIESVMSCFPPEYFVESYLKCKIEGGDYI